MNLLKVMKEKSKKVFSAAFIVAILASSIIPMSAQAVSPKFNFMDGDAKTLRGSNRTAGDTGWTNSVSGKVGDEFRGIVYLHNGILDTTATNTKVKVSLPTATTNNKFSVTVTISADNATSVTDTLLVSLNGNANVQFIPGTVAWYPTINGDATKIQSLPSGQSGNEITTTGVNLGNIKGCWEYVQYLTFGFKTVPQGSFNLTIDKLVKNVTSNEASYIDSNKAHAGDTLEYKITYKNTGNAVAPAAVMTDLIPANTSYIVGTTRLSKNNGSEVNPGDGLTTSSIALGDLNPGDSGVVRFRIKTSTGLANNQVLINIASVSSSKITVTDTAKTIIYSGTTPTPENHLPITGAGTIALGVILSLVVFLGYTVLNRRKSKSMFRR